MISYWFLITAGGLATGHMKAEAADQLLASAVGILSPYLLSTSTPSKDVIQCTAQLLRALDAGESREELSLSASRLSEFLSCITKLPHQV